MTRARTVQRDPVLLAQALVALFATAWYLIGPGGPVPYWMIQLGMDTLFVLLCARVSRLAGPAVPLVRRFWRAMTVAGVCFLSGDVIQVMVLLRDPGAGAVGAAQSAFVAVGVCCLVFAMLTHPLGGTGSERTRLFLDAATVMTAVGVFVWYFLVSDRIGAVDPGILVTAVVGSALILMAAFGLAKLLLSGTAPFTLPAALVGGASALAIGLLTALNPVLAGSDSHGLIVVVRLLPAILFVATPRVQELQMRARPDVMATRPRRPYSRLPYLGVTATQLLLVQDLLRHRPVPAASWGATLGALAITALVVTRQLLAFRENARLLSTLDESLLQLRRQEERFRSLVQHASDVTLVATADDRIAYASPALERVLGFPPPYQSAGNLSRRVHPDDLPAVARMQTELLADPGGTSAAQLRMRHADGSWRWLDVLAVNLLDNPSVNGVVYNARDVTEARRLQDRLRYEATHDALTRLANRALFDERVNQASATASGDVTILVIDLDDFKKINDSYGHAAGDALLVAMAQRLRECVRPSDTVARLGGDEFAVLLPGTPPEHARVLADRMAFALAVPVEVEGQLMAVGASIGIATGDRSDADRLLREADAAMYRAKQGAR